MTVFSWHILALRLAGVSLAYSFFLGPASSTLLFHLTQILLHDSTDMHHLFAALKRVCIATSNDAYMSKQRLHVPVANPTDQDPQTPSPPPPQVRLGAMFHFSLTC